METDGRWNLAKTAIARVLDLLTPYDFFAVVLFSNEVRAFRDVMTQATPGNIQEAIAFLPAEPDGGTDFLVGLRKGFDIIKNSVNIRRSVCETATCF
jgi:uncharacterized protein with von Willebrand factor type A (vWA) domain